MKLRNPLEASLAGLVTRKDDGRRGARGYWDRQSRYDGAALRDIRAKKGVGRPPAVGLRRLTEWLGRGYPFGDISPFERFFGAIGDHETPCEPEINMAEWLRKPRSKRHAARAGNQ